MAEYKTEIDRMIAERADKQTVLTYLFVEKNKILFNLAIKLTRDTEEAKELFSEAFLKIMNNLDKYRINTNFNAWVSKVLVNVFLDKYRKKQNERAGMEIACKEAEMKEQGIKSPLEEVIGVELRKIIDDTIKTLPAVQRAVIVLHDIQGLGTGEISEMLAVRSSTIRTNLSLAREKVRSILGPYLEEK